MRAEFKELIIFKGCNQGEDHQGKEVCNLRVVLHIHREVLEEPIRQVVSIQLEGRHIRVHLDILAVGLHIPNHTSELRSLVGSLEAFRLLRILEGVVGRILFMLLKDSVVKRLVDELVEVP